jgi:hypothetical protein
MRSDDRVLDETEDANNKLDGKAGNWLHLVMLVVEQSSMLSEFGFREAKGLFRFGELRLALLHSTFETLDIVGYGSRELIISDFGWRGKRGRLEWVSPSDSYEPRRTLTHGGSIVRIDVFFLVDLGERCARIGRARQGQMRASGETL